MTTGTIAIGLSGFVFLSVIGHGRLDPATAAALATVFLLSNILGPGVFVAIEQETSRRVGGRAAPPSSTVRATVVVTAAALAVLAVGGVVLLDPVLRGDAGPLFALALCVAGSGVVFHGRGVLGGRRRFRRYGTGLLVDAGVRVVGVAVLAAAGVTAGVAYALVWCAGPAAAAAVTRPRPDGGDAPGAPDRRGVAAGVAALLVASLLSMGLANLAPVLVTAALPADPVRAFGFACAVVMTRAPLLLIGPIQAMLLPGMATAAARGATAELRSRLRRGLQVVGGLGAVAVAGAGWVGRPVLRLLFGPDADVLPAGVIAALTLSAVLLMAVAVTQLTVVALGGHRVLTAAWISGAVAFGAVFAGVADRDPVAAGVAATLVAPVVTLGMLLAGTRRAY